MDIQRFTNWISNFPKVARPSWDEYFLLMAFLVSRRSACYRTQCGAVIVKDHNLISSGYNGAPIHQPNCQEIGFCYRNKHGIKSGTQLELCRACGSHSESNAIAMASKHGHSTLGSTMYIYGNKAICTQCKAMIANAGIIKVVYLDMEGNIAEIIPKNDWKEHNIDMK